MRVSQSLLAICFLVPGIAANPSSTSAAESAKPQIEAFSLPVWGKPDRFNLDEAADAIIVLDFFAYWCAPCLQASRDLERNIDRYYETRQGNAYGLPVKVVSINIDRDFPAKTDTFIEESGVRLVLDDPGGSLLAKLGGKALPFFAIITKRDNEDSTSAWEVLYRRSGYEGAEAFRSIIDSIERSDSSIAVEASQSTEDDPPPAPLALDPVEYIVNSEVLHSSDISLQSLSILRRHSQKRWEWDLNMNFRRIDVDYEPFSDADIIGKQTRLLESNGSLQVSARYARSPILQYRFSGGGYYGFSDHRSLWLDEYYRQQFSGLSGYEYANPWGVNLSGGVQWDTLSSFGLLGMTLVAQQDDVAPGYDRPLFQELERGRQRLNTGSLLLEQESIISKNARMRHQASVTRTTDRQLRYRYSGYLNYSLSEHWVIRTEGTATFEATAAEGESDFHSYSAGITVERDWDQRLFVSLAGRKYEDNGQIETSILVSSGPPPLETTHLGATLRWQGERNAYKVSLASYRSRFDEVDSPIRPFGNLYKDRDWLLISLSFNRSF